MVVVHCKAGKGRSGTASCSATSSPRRAGHPKTQCSVSPSVGCGKVSAWGLVSRAQQRWIRYVGRWTKGGKVYVERPVEVLEVHCWGLRDGVKIVMEGFRGGGEGD